MKVYVHLNRGREKSYLLTFPKDVTKKEIRDLLAGDYHNTLYLLANRSRTKISVLPKDRQRAKNLADFTLTEKYTAERLA